jgi:hypothetical protein
MIPEASKWTRDSTPDSVGISLRTLQKYKRLDVPKSHCRIDSQRQRLQVLKNQAPNRPPKHAAFLGSSDFADFPVGSDCFWCYRIDVAVIVMSGGFCQTWLERGDAGPSNHDVVSPDGSGKTQKKAQGEKHVGIVQKDK